MKFTRAIVRTPSESMVHGLSNANLGKPDYRLALAQHQKYVDALQSCGVAVTVLPPDENFPDSTFVEDTALLTPECAIITRPGAESRRGEEVKMKKAVAKFYSKLEGIDSPGTLEAGDVMMVGNHYYIGLSERTNQAGAQQLLAILKKYGMSGSTVALKEVLHLKTGVAYLENNIMVVCGEFLNESQFQKFNLLEIPETESYAANCIWINDHVLMPAGFPEAKKMVRQSGYPILELDMSEFRKLDGGLSCLSLRF